MINSSLFGGTAAKDRGLPGVAIPHFSACPESAKLADLQVRIEVDHRDRAIGTVYGAQEGKSDSVITTKSNDSRESLALLGRTDGLGIGFGSAGEDGVMPFLDLFQGVVVVVAVAGAQYSGHQEARTGTYEVTGISPQSMTVAQELKGLALRGTLYPPYRFKRRLPWRIPLGPNLAPGRYEVPVSKGAPADYQCEVQNGQRSVP